MKKSMIRDIALLGLATAFLAPVVTLAGDLNPPAAPTATGSAMYTTDDIYFRLEAGDAGTLRSGAFAEPGAGPANSVGKSLNDIMDKAPAKDDVNGATPADVVLNKTYWSLRTGISNGTDNNWGLHAGTRPPAPVAKTGQTLCYDAAGDSIACGNGQEVQKGVSLPSPRFHDNGNGTVTDNLTGLVWLKNANCFGARTWSQALTDAASLDTNVCGLTGVSEAGKWRLPNEKELSSLVNLNYFNPALSNTVGDGQWTSGQPFTNVQSDLYWSSSSVISGPSGAWNVNLNSGIVGGDFKTSTYAVWPVRDGQ